MIGYDIDESKIAALQRGETTLFEPGLAELLAQGSKSSRLTFTTELGDALANADLALVAIGTEGKPDGSADLSGIEAFAKDAAPLIGREMTIAVKSTVPVGTGDWLERIFSENCPHPVHIASNPEFLKEGTAVDDFRRPDRVVIGFENEAAGDLLRTLYQPFVRSHRPILEMRRREAEIAKYACNAMLAARISFVNEMANLCSALGVDVDEVRRVMATDDRIGPRFLYPGVGYGGSCFPKDVRALIHTAEKEGLEPRMLRATDQTNEQQKERLVERAVAHLGASLPGSRVAVWGVAFKPNTDDIREAPALVGIERLLDAGCRIVAHDPEALESLERRFGDRIGYEHDQYRALDGAAALLIFTEWSDYRSPDFERMLDTLARPVVFDGRNLYDPEQMAELGFDYHTMGRRPVEGAA